MKYYLYRYLVFRDGSSLIQVWNQGHWLFHYQTSPMYFDTKYDAARYRKAQGLSNRKIPCRIGETP